MEIIGSFFPHYFFFYIIQNDHIILKMSDNVMLQFLYISQLKFKDKYKII